MTTQTPKYNPTELTRGLLDAADMLDQLRAMCVARRKALEADGFSPTMAESMAATLWITALSGGGNS